MVSTVHDNRWKTLGVLSLSLVIIGLDNTILNVALPTLQEEFYASGSTLQWMVDAYLLVFAGLLLVFGTLGDRFGRKLALQSGIAIFGLASLGALVADSAGQVIAIRSLMGVGAALIMPATLSIIANVFPPEERGKAIGIWAALAAVGIGLGPLAGGAADRVVRLVRRVPRQRAGRARRACCSASGSCRRAATRGRARSTSPARRSPRPASRVLVYAIIEAPETGWGSATIVGLLAGALALLAAFVWWERRTPHPMLDLGFFRNADFSVGTAAVSWRSSPCSAGSSRSRSTCSSRTATRRSRPARS